MSVQHPLQGASFDRAAHIVRELPADAGIEIAFAGRSNAGKSSALNTLVGVKSLARTSKTPGRTQQMVVFNLPSGYRLIDLPGYGYAKVPEALRKHWHQQREVYLSNRHSLRGLVLIMDIRHPLRDFDREILRFSAVSELPCHLLLSKADKLSRSERVRTLQQVRKDLASTPFIGAVQIFSATTRIGVEEARLAVAQLLGMDTSLASTGPFPDRLIPPCS
ncbi:MAG TPA: YihA family ribosome biogenesis GTP-binding protein [Mizugakiibacter sp.]|mgnify:CR=1 FL=1|nr:YihA family ribosome biogenesis GTP-binding protein [Mizugakiibacter sp.]